MSNEKHVEGVCPNCATRSIELGDWENFSGDLGREWECRSCGAYGVAYYDYKFGEYAIHGNRQDDDDDMNFISLGQNSILDYEEIDDLHLLHKMNKQ